MSCDAYSRPLTMMRHFHAHHQHQLRSFTQRTSSLSSLSAAHSLSRDLLSFCRSLHVHHSIEDAQLFPFLASRTDISHLEKHHAQLADTLHEMEALAASLRALKAIDGYDQHKAVELVTRAERFVVMHETAEEALLHPDSLRRLCTEGEIRALGF